MAAQQLAHELEKMALNHIQNTREGKLDSKFSNKSSLCGRKGGRVSLLCAFLLGALCHTIIYLSTEEKNTQRTTFQRGVVVSNNNRQLHQPPTTPTPQIINHPKAPLLSKKNLIWKAKNFKSADNKKLLHLFNDLRNAKSQMRLLWLSFLTKNHF